MRLIKSKFFFSVVVFANMLQCKEVRTYYALAAVLTLVHVVRISKREQRTRLYNAVVVVLSYSGKPNPDALLASKNEHKQTVASEESQVEADMINFELMDGHGYLLSTNCSFSSSHL